MKIKWPDDKNFAFTIVDDTDNSTIENVKPVYDCLYKNGVITTKTIWTYPSRDHFVGQSLQDNDYLLFIKELTSVQRKFC